MSRPIIGITTDSEPGKNGKPHGKQIIRQEYIDRVREAGGTPILLPAGTLAEEVAPLLDGWLIPGGDDLDPSLWGEELHPEARLANPARLELEQGLWQALPPETPVFGICYGCQLINVLHGGSLHQHLPDLVGHDQHRGDTWQKYEVDSSSKLGQILKGVQAEGKSYHHQAVRQVGQGLRVSAHHPEDGAIEGVESTERPWVVGVQWHPERSESEATPLLFAEFIEQARQWRAKRKG